VPAHIPTDLGLVLRCVPPTMSSLYPPWPPGGPVANQCLGPPVQERCRTCGDPQTQGPFIGTKPIEHSRQGAWLLTRKRWRKVNDRLTLSQRPVLRRRLLRTFVSASEGLTSHVPHGGQQFWAHTRVTYIPRKPRKRPFTDGLILSLVGYQVDPRDIMDEICFSDNLPRVCYVYMNPGILRYPPNLIPLLRKPLQLDMTWFVRSQ
jgi:hypothetical protein